MRRRLNLSKSYLDFIVDTSKGPRHGDRSYIDQPTLNEVIKRSWIIMNRFLECRLREGEALPSLEFPEL